MPLPLAASLSSFCYYFKDATWDVRLRHHLTCGHYFVYLKEARLNTSPKYESTIKYRVVKNFYKIHAAAHHHVFNPDVRSLCAPIFVPIVLCILKCMIGIAIRVRKPVDSLSTVQSRSRESGLSTQLFVESR
jgi:hypothetical protein